MQYRLLVALALSLLAGVLAAKVNPAFFTASCFSQVDAPEVESSVLVRGRTSTLTIAGKSLSPVKSVGIEPPDGVRVIEIRKPEARADGLTAVSIVLAVAANAEIGQRTATLTTADNRTDIVWFSIGTHNLTISNLKLESKRQEVSRMEETTRVIAEAGYSFSFEDEAGDISADEAGIQITLKCGRTGSAFYVVPTRIVLENQQRGLVFLSVHQNQLAHATPDCELQFRLKDRDGNESNRLKTALPFTGQ